MASPKPQRLQVWLCPTCSGGYTMLPPLGIAEPGEYELQLPDYQKHAHGADEVFIRGVYITAADAEACIARHQVAARVAARATLAHDWATGDTDA